MSGTDTEKDKSKMATTLSRDEQGVKAERLRQLRLRRSSAKGTITKKSQEVRELFKDIDSVALLKQKLSDLETAAIRFEEVHNEFHVHLEDRVEQMASQDYYDYVIRGVKELYTEAQEWIASVTTIQKASEMVKEEYSARQDERDTSVFPKLKKEINFEVTSARSSNVSSKLSRSSSISSAKAKVVAKKAALMVEAASISQKQELEHEELRLRQRKKELELKIEIAKADAQEQAFTEAEVEDGMNDYVERAVKFSEPVSTEAPLSQRKFEDIISWKENVAETQQKTTKENHTYHDSFVPGIRHTSSFNPDVRVSTIGQQHSLNPEAPVWQGNSNTSNLHQFDSNPVTDTGTNSEHLLHLLHEGQRQQQQLLNVIQLPKAELISFDGDPLKYWLFIRTFENNVETLGQVNDNAKLTCLLQYCTGNAKKAIECCSIMEPSEGYRKAKKLLRDRFGDDYVIAEAWIEKVTERSKLKPTDRCGLMEFADELQNCKETLSAMNKLEEINNQKSLVKIIEKLPIYHINRWKKRAYEIRKVRNRATFIDVVQFVKDIAEEANDPVYGKITEFEKDKMRAQKSRPARKPHGDKHMLTNFNTQASDKKDKLQSANSFPTASSKMHGNCPLCSKDHTLFSCEEFKKMNPMERFKLVCDKKLCNNCLQPGHFATRCYKQSRCTVPGCGRKHTKFIHLKTGVTEMMNTSQKTDNDMNNVTDESTSLKSVEVRNGFTEVNNTTVCNSTGAGIKSRTLTALPVLPVLIKSSTGRFVQTHALLDSGSTNTFCTEALIKSLGLHGTADVLTLTTLERESSPMSTTVVSLEVGDVQGKNVIQLPKVYTRKCLPVHSENIAKQEDLTQWPHLRDIKLPSVKDPVVSLLIGQDVPEALIPLEVCKGDPGSPYASRTLLGWSVNGPLSMIQNHRSVSNFIHMSHEDSILTRQVEQFWKLEDEDSLADDTTKDSPNDRYVTSLWNRTIHQNPDGHYEMPIPFKSHSPMLPNNRFLAAHRLELLGKRLQKNPDLHNKYNDGMNDLLKKGYAEKIPDDEISDADRVVWYLPHHPVFHAKKPEKVRIVFDCAARYKGSSLNDEVFKGPDLMNNLIGVLIRFREEPVALMADIEAMFHQVRVLSSRCDVLRFLWWPSGNMDLKPAEYRMTVHLFGGVWSPSCSGFALRQVPKDYQSEFDQYTISTVNRNFYVDDCLKSVSSPELAIRLSSQLTKLLARGGFRLTKWICNDRNVLASIPEEERAKEVKDFDFQRDDLPVERALGLQWDVESDQFMFRTTITDKPVTRRGILSYISSIYDPLGFLSPFILPAKRILQQVCKLKLGWDETLPEKELTAWEKWKDDLPKMAHFRIDRCMKPQILGNIAVRQLHHFTDASQCAYGVVTYLRLVDSDGQICCSFVLSKCRLAPIKSVTIPRLELSAASLAVKVDRMVRRELDIQIDDSFFWTDSTLVLQYIHNKDKRFQTFVANRIAAIHAGSEPEQWHYVSTKCNPADHVSRGMTADEVIQTKSWLLGPQFLWCDTQQWPENPEVLKTQTSLIPVEEIKKDVQIYVAKIEDTEDMISRMFHRYSSWYRLKKCVAWILRAKKHLQKKTFKPDLLVQEGHLTTQEIKDAEVEIVKYVQRQSFKDEIKILTQTVDANDQRTVKYPLRVKKSSPLYRLDPIMLSNGVLCVGGRLNYAPIDDEAKHQMILPKSSHVVDLIINHYHKVAGHSGQEHVLALMRQRFWIIKARRTIAKILRTCLDCIRQRHLPQSQKMADLPVNRATPDKPPFSFVGVDYFGPFFVKRGRSLVKRYGCIFTCLVLRAVHIEISQSLDTDSFINALQRFISRRGTPIEIRSDNGTNFVGAQRELSKAIREWNHNKIEHMLKQKEISWQFNPPAASHMGGAWERQIRTVRKVFGTLLKQQTMDDEVLSTLMCQVESVINSRPITVVSNDVRDPEPLTPNHLLLLRAGPSLPPGIFVKEDLYSKRRWKQVQYLADIFWRRWIKEYLPTLQARQKWLHPSKNIKVGDVVLIAGENTPRNLWPMGRVVTTYPGRDGYVRTVQVRTASSTLVRPINKLILLESI